jgi:hypothetical protein
LAKNSSAVTQSPKTSFPQKESGLGMRMNCSGKSNLLRFGTKGVAAAIRSGDVGLAPRSNGIVQSPVVILN